MRPRSSFWRWEIAGAFTVTASRALLWGQWPGEERRYRVTASRNGVNSLPSNEAIIYPRQGIMEQAA